VLVKTTWHAGGTEVLQNMKLSPFVPVVSARVRDRIMCRRGPCLGPVCTSPSLLPHPRMALSLPSSHREREREREKERALSSRYHKSFEVLIRSHTQRLFRAWHPPDLAPTWRIIRRPLHGLCPRDIPSLFVLKRSLPEIHGLSAKRK